MDRCDSLEHIQLPPERATVPRGHPHHRVRAAPPKSATHRNAASHVPGPQAVLEIQQSTRSNLRLRSQASEDHRDRPPNTRSRRQPASEVPQSPLGEDLRNRGVARRTSTRSIAEVRHRFHLRRHARARQRSSRRSLPRGSHSSARLHLQTLLGAQPPRASRCHPRQPALRWKRTQVH